MEYQSIDSDQSALRQLKDLKRVDVQTTEHWFLKFVSSSLRYPGDRVLATRNLTEQESYNNSLIFLINMIPLV